MAKLEDSRVSLSQGLAYSLPISVTVFLLYPVQILLAGMYAKYFGLSLTTIAAIVFAARLFDAVTDPLIGYFSDRYRIRHGTRKPWVVVGCISLVISSYFLLVPPENVSAFYFLGWYFAFYLSWTMVDVPHYAWGGEIATNSQEKNRIYSLRAMCAFVGALIFAAVPLLPFFEGNSFTPETLKWSVIASATVIIPALLVCTKCAPDGRESVNPRKVNIRFCVKAILRNKPLLILLGACCLIGLSFGLWVGLTYIFVDTYLHLGDKLPLIFALSSVSALAVSGLIYNISRYFEKTQICSFAIISSSLAMGGHALLNPGSGALIVLVVLSCSAYIGNAIYNIMMPSMLSDIVDYGAWKFGVEQGATYFSLYLFLVKITVGIGSAFGLWLIGVYGFDASGSIHSHHNIFGLRLGIAYIPAVLYLASLFFVVITPINANRHKIIQKRLAARIQ